jgi:hypothetical protein
MKNIIRTLDSLPSNVQWMINKKLENLWKEAFILWHIDPLLGKILETKEITDVVMQWRSKHASTTIVLLEMVFSTRSVRRGYKEDNWGVT